MAEPQPIEIHCADGRVLPGRLHGAVNPVASLLVAPALGVPRRYYDAFATGMAEAGIATLTFDYRGIGDAQGSADEDRKVTLAQWGELDIAAALAFQARQSPDLPMFYIGHSCGTQLMGLAAGSEKIAGLVFVAGSSPNAKHWRGGARLAVEFMWRVLVPLLGRRPRFPARQVGFASVDVPGGVMRQWADWCRSPRYLFSPEHGYDLSRYRSFAMPVLSYEFSDDPFAPRKTIDALLAQMPKLKVTRRQLSPADVGAKRVGHAGFFHRSHAENLWKPCAGWILGVAGRKNAAAA